MKKWNLRWFEQVGTKINYFKEPDGEILGKIEIEKIQRIEADPNNKTFTLKMIQGKEIYLQADSRIQFQYWVKGVFYPKLFIFNFHLYHSLLTRRGKKKLQLYVKNKVPSSARVAHVSPGSISSLDSIQNESSTNSSNLLISYKRSKSEIGFAPPFSLKEESNNKKSSATFVKRKREATRRKQTKEKEGTEKREQLDSEQEGSEGREEEGGREKEGGREGEGGREEEGEEGEVSEKSFRESESWRKSSKGNPQAISQMQQETVQMAKQLEKQLESNFPKEEEKEGVEEKENVSTIELDNVMNLLEGTLFSSEIADVSQEESADEKENSSLPTKSTFLHLPLHLKNHARNSSSGVHSSLEEVDRDIDSIFKITNENAERLKRKVSKNHPPPPTTATDQDTDENIDELERQLLSTD